MIDAITRYKEGVGMILKDPTQIAKFVMPEESEQATLRVLINHWYLQDTIPLDECIRLKQLVDSPDKENMEIAKVILQQKYKLL